MIPQIEAHIYRKAANVIRRRGLAKGYFGSSGGPRCIFGALSEAGAFCPSGAFSDLREVVGSPLRFNDHPDTTAEDVIAALEIAADLAS